MCRPDCNLRRGPWKKMSYYFVRRGGHRRLAWRSCCTRARAVRLARGPACRPPAREPAPARLGLVAVPHGDIRPLRIHPRLARLSRSRRPGSCSDDRYRSRPFANMYEFSVAFACILSACTTGLSGATTRGAGPPRAANCAGHDALRGDHPGGTSSRSSRPSRTTSCSRPRRGRYRLPLARSRSRSVRRLLPPPASGFCRGLLKLAVPDEIGYKAVVTFPVWHAVLVLGALWADVAQSLLGLIPRDRASLVT